MLKLVIDDPATRLFRFIYTLEIIKQKFPNDLSTMIFTKIEGIEAGEEDSELTSATVHYFHRQFPLMFSSNQLEGTLR